MNRPKFKNVPVVSPDVLEQIRTNLLQKKNEIEVSLDLNLSKTKVILHPKEFSFQISFDNIIPFPKSFNSKKKVCYAIFDGQIHPIKFFSQETQLYYKLVPTSYRPILRISATQMHKYPFLNYIENLELEGKILDGGTGLGYSAIIASLTAEHVITIEWDPHIIEIASFNPHSMFLFSKSNITLIEEDITHEVQNYPPEHFNNIIQDGGTPKSSGHFFSFGHCQELFRVLKSGGSLLIYLPRHGQSKGRDFGYEHLERLEKAGFVVKHRDIEGSFAELIKNL